MIVKDEAGREIEIEIYGKYEDDINIDSAIYLDTGEYVPDSVVNYILDAYAGDIYEEWYQNQVMRAEAMSDYMEDR